MIPKDFPWRLKALSSIGRIRSTGMVDSQPTINGGANAGSLLSNILRPRASRKRQLKASIAAMSARPAWSSRTLSP